MRWRPSGVPRRLCSMYDSPRTTGSSSNAFLSTPHPASSFHRSAFLTRSRLIAVATSAVASSSALQITSVLGSATRIRATSLLAMLVRLFLGAAAGYWKRGNKSRDEHLCLRKRNVRLMPNKQPQEIARNTQYACCSTLARLGPNETTQRALSNRFGVYTAVARDAHIT